VTFSHRGSWAGVGIFALTQKNKNFRATCNLKQLVHDSHERDSDSSSSGAR
jgi:hypothetical protein